MYTAGNNIMGSNILMKDYHSLLKYYTFFQNFVNQIETKKNNKERKH